MNNSITWIFCAEKEKKLYIENAKNKGIQLEWIGEIEKITDYELDFNNVSQVILVLYGLNTKNAVKLLERLPSDTKYCFVISLFEQIIVSKMMNVIEKGCIECCITRWISTKKDRKQLIDIVSMNVQINNYSLITPTLIDYIVSYISKNDMGNNNILIINRNKFQMTTHRLIPIPTCQVCSSLKEDSLEHTNDQFSEYLLRDNQIKYRNYALKELEEYLNKTYLDNELGIFNFILDDIEAPFAVSVANLPILKGKDEVGVGRTDRYCTSRAIAFLEGLERYCGIEPRGKKTVYNAAYKEVLEVALNPTKLGLHSQSQYLRKGFPFKQFHNDEKIDWVSAYNMTTNKAILVPETIAYYGINLRDENQKNFVYEISNGCAIGGSIKEAIMSGLLEVIERDAFLITWYNKIPLVEIDYEGFKNSEIILMKEKFEYLFDYRLRTFNMTLDTGVPTVITVAINNTNNQYMNLMCAAGCSTKMDEAITNSIHELCDILPALNKKFLERKDELSEMIHNFDLVKTMEDHSLLYGLKEMSFAFDFLLKKNNSITIKNEKLIEFKNDITKDLKQIINCLETLGLEVIVVDQTAEELTYEKKLFCTKVIVPGMLPMTFGHAMYRIDNLPRIFKVPDKYNFISSIKDDLQNENVLPHPFP